MPDRGTPSGCGGCRLHYGGINHTVQHHEFGCVSGQANFVNGAYYIHSGRKRCGCVRNGQHLVVGNVSGHINIGNSDEHNGWAACLATPTSSQRPPPP